MFCKEIPYNNICSVYKDRFLYLFHQVLLAIHLFCIAIISLF